MGSTLLTLTADVVVVGTSYGVSLPYDDISMLVSVVGLLVGVNEHPGTPSKRVVIVVIVRIPSFVVVALII